MHVIEIDFSDRVLVERYDRLFESCPDAFIQQSTYWGNSIRDLGPDRPIFLLCHDSGEDIAALPLYLYEHELGNILTSVPQPGPLGGIFHKSDMSTDTKRRVFQCLLLKCIDIARQYNCIDVSLITNPFANDLDLYEEFFAPDFILENFTQFIPLDSPVHLSSRKRWNLRRNIEKATNFGYSVDFCDNLEELSAWYQIHSKRHSEIGAAPLDYRLFARLFERLVPMGKAKLVLVRHEGEIASGCFYVYHKKIVDVFMLSMNSRYADSSPNFLNTRFSLEWAQQQGFHIYNWQSSPSRQSGVYEFKRQWGSIESKYHYITKLLCKPKKIVEIGIDNIRTHYKWHYVVPFSVFTDGFDIKYIKKGV